MKKLSFDRISIELTRDCNMACRHCFRGEAENMVIDNKYIDCLFGQTDMIGGLFFTGGEPTLAVDKMEYILEKLHQYAIPLFQFEFVTNGFIYSEKLIDVIKKYSELVTLCRETIYGKETFPHYYNVIIGISFDQFHSNRKIVEENFIKYENALSGIAQVKKIGVGNLWRKEGRAKELKKGIKNLDMEQHLIKRIELVDKDHKPMCPQWKSYQLLTPDQIIVVCDMYLSAKGNLLTESLGMHEYSFVDDQQHIVCNVADDDIYDSILRYNIGKYDCLTVMQGAAMLKMSNPLKYFSDNLFELQAKDTSDLIFVNKNTGYVNMSDFETKTISDTNYPARLRAEINDSKFDDKMTI